jgi:F0F1-type ATP synthase assembly protein I
MTGKNRRSWLTHSVDEFQENMTKAAPVAGVGYTLIGAILVLGGGGYAIDRWQETSPWWMLGGLGLGLIVGFYELAKAVWPRS